MIRFFVFLLLLQVTLLANIQERVEGACPKEYKNHQEFILKYLIRMEDDINSKGCNVIPIYSAIIEAEKFELLDNMEDNPKLITQLKKLLSINPKLSNLIFKNTIMKNIILDNSMDDSFLENFTYIAKERLYRKEIKQISKNNLYLNYVLLASLYTSTPKEGISLYNQFKSSISIELMPSFVLILSSVGNKYPFEELLENFSTIERSLSRDAVKTLAQYPQYFAYFLYPKKEDLKVDVMSSSRLREIQKDIQKEALFLYEKMYEKYRYKNGINQIDYALLTVEYIYPYLLEQYDIEYDDFTTLFNKLIDKEYILSLFVEDKCSNGSKDNFAVFGQNNIKNVIKLKNKEKNLVNTLINELKPNNIQDNKNAFMAFFYVANLYNHLNEKEWKIFKKLLKILPNSYQVKLAFIQKIEKNGYFRNIVIQNDYDVMITSEYWSNNPKYAYILLTPYPEKDDSTLFDQILYTNIEDNILQSALIELIRKNRDELETHEFTGTEKFIAGVDNADDALFVIAIVLVPFTGGVSLGAVAAFAAKKMLKITTKKGIKRGMRLMALDAKRNIKKTKTFLENPNKHMRTKKREKVVSALKNKVDNVGHGATAVYYVGIGSLIFMGSNLEAKIICEEKE